MRADLKRLSKLAKAYAAASEPLNDLGLEFAEQLQEFGSGKDEAGPPMPSVRLRLIVQQTFMCASAARCSSSPRRCGNCSFSSSRAPSRSRSAFGSRQRPQRRARSKCAPCSRAAGR